MKKIIYLSLFLAILSTISVYFLLPKQHSELLETKENVIEVVEERPIKPFIISEEKRAISIPVNEVQGISGFVKPDDYVDIVVMVPPPDGENASSQILLQNVRVLAVGGVFGETDSATNQYRTVTLEVDPMEGSSLAFAVEKGTATLLLRPENDNKFVPHHHITLEQLNKGVKEVEVKVDTTD